MSKIKVVDQKEKEYLDKKKMHNEGIDKVCLKEIMQKVSNLLKRRCKKKFWNETYCTYVENASKYRVSIFK